MKITVTCSPNNESFTYCQRISVSVIKLVFNINETLGHVCLGWCTLWRASALHHVSQQPQEGGDSFQGKRFKRLLQPQGETVCIIRTEVVTGTRGNCRNSPGVGALTSANGKRLHASKEKVGSRNQLVHLCYSNYLSGKHTCWIWRNRCYN